MNLNELHNTIVGSWSKLLQLLVAAKDRIFKMKPFNLKIFETVVILLSVFIGVFLAQQYPVDQSVRIHEVDIKGITVPNFFDKLDLLYHTLWNFITNFFTIPLNSLKNLSIKIGLFLRKFDFLQFLTKIPLFLYNILLFLLKPLLFVFRCMVDLAKLTFNFFRSFGLKLWQFKLPKINLTWFLKPLILLWRLVKAPFITLYNLLLMFKLNWLLKPFALLKDMLFKLGTLICNFFIKLWNMVISINLGWFFKPILLLKNLLIKLGNIICNFFIKLWNAMISFNLEWLFKPFIAIWRFMCLAFRMLKIIILKLWSSFSFKGIVNFLLRPFVLVWYIFKYILRLIRSFGLWLKKIFISIYISLHFDVGEFGWWILKPLALVWKFIYNLFNMVRFIITWNFSHIRELCIKCISWKPHFHFRFDFKVIINFLLKPLYLIWDVLKWPFVHFNLKFFTRPFVFMWEILVSIGNWFRNIHFGLPDFNGFFIWLLKPIFAIWRFLTLTWRLLLIILRTISLAFKSFALYIKSFSITLCSGWHARFSWLFNFLIRPFILLKKIILNIGPFFRWLCNGIRIAFVRTCLQLCSMFKALWLALLWLLRFLMRPFRLIWYLLGQIHFASFAGLKDFWDNVCEPEMLN